MDLLTDADETVSGQPEPKSEAPRSKIDWNLVLKWSFLSVGILMLLALVAIAVPYWQLAKRVDKELAAGPFQHTYSFYAAPATVAAGDQETPAELVAALRGGGMRQSTGNDSQTFTASDDAVVIRGATPVRVDFAGNQVRSITDLDSKKKLDEYDLPPQLITNLSDAGRAKRLMVHYSDLPPVLVQALTSAEDKHFFQHDGLDGRRIVKAFYVDFREHRKEQGASTITMQLARNLWLDRDKSWKRKVAETLITLHLEHKLSKQQILEYYCNQVYLGGVGTYSINGFGEAAHAYFNKDIHNLSLTEAATLAGLVQRPSYFNPLRYPQHAVDHRNIVLTLMRENGYITPEQYQEASAAPLGLHPRVDDMSETQYFLDIASDQLQRRMEDLGGGAANVYTTLDLRLQRAAEKAVQDGMELVDKQLAKSKRKGLTGRPQVALIALDPHTGDVKALIGGRDYATSQLNRVLAKRPPGSVFKPFVYTAAINTALEGGSTVFTPASTIMDAPTTFQFGRVVYNPGNFKNEYMGQVTLRQALAHSLNVATVKLAQQVGYDNVVSLAHRMGLNEHIQATPAVALGAYDVTPLEIASAYTAFDNGGVREKPNFVDSVRNSDGDSVYDYSPAGDPVLDPRVAFVMTDMLQEVLRSGTAAGVRARGFKLPAAGKTGTSHDGWFAGYTSQLLCVVWVGFDDYQELGLEGAKSALPIWTEFMTEAARYQPYRAAKPFSPPAGVVKATVDPASGNLAGPNCPGGVTDYFIEGTAPTTQCPEPPHEFFPAEADRSAAPAYDGQPQAVVQTVVTGEADRAQPKPAVRQTTTYETYPMPKRSPASAQNPPMARRSPEAMPAPPKKTPPAFPTPPEQ